MNISMIYTTTEYAGNARALRICDIFRKAAAMNVQTVITADPDTMCAAPEIITAAHSNNMKASVGLKLTLCEYGHHGQIALLPKNYNGFIAIGKLFESASRTGNTRHPTITLHDLENHFRPCTMGYGNVIIATCGMDGLLANIIHSNTRAAADMLKRLTDIFGQNDVFAEVQYHGLPAERKVFSGIAALADAAGIPLLATNDPFFVANTKKDIIAYKLLGFADTKNYKPLSDDALEHYIKTPEQLKLSVKKILTPDQCKRAMQGRSDFASVCDVQIPTDTHYPSYCTDTGMTSDDLLRRTVENAIPHRCKKWTAEYEQRLDHELDIIKSKGFSDYILIAADIVRFAREMKNNNNCLTVGPGRGSSAGSLVCYLLGITDIDPIPYGLMFERFISPWRSTMPDIDMDTAACIRDEVIRYVSAKYGVDAICGIYVPVCYRAKEAIAITGRYLSVKTGDREYDDIAQRMTSVCKDSSGVDDNLTELEALCKDKKGKAIIFGARSIDGRFKTLSKHAAGIILSDSKDISDYIPVCYDTHEKMLMAQCGNKSVESIYGLLKIDLLSLPTLDVISAMLASIAKTEKITIDFSAIPEEYEVFRDVFFDAHTDFIFQFGSSGMQEQLKRTHPMNIRELMLINAAYRPGPIKCLDIISDVLMDKKPVEYLTPLLAPILKETCGCIIYQEQVMQIFTDVAGYTPEDADRIRGAISKKKKDVITAEHDNFVRGCMNNGISQEVADTLYEQIVSFGAYAFNRSHAAAYSVLAYRMAWLFYKYPTHFLASVFAFSNKKQKAGTFFKECHRLNIKLLPPDINLSAYRDQAVDDGILIGLSSIDGITFVGQKIENDRHKRGKDFEDLADFLLRIHPNETELKNLAICGAFDCFKVTRSSIAVNAGELVSLGYQLQDLYKRLNDEKNPERIKQIKQQVKDCKESITGLSTGASTMDIVKIGKAEQELMGMPLSFCKMHDFDASGDSRRTTTIKAITQGHHRICGMIYSYKELMRKNDKAKFCKIELMDDTGTIVCMLSAKNFHKFEERLSEGEYVCLSGEYDNNKTRPTFWIDGVSELEPSSISYYLSFDSYIDMMKAQPIINQFVDYPLANLYIKIAGGDYAKYPHKVSPEITNSFPNIEVGKTL